MVLQSTTLFVTFMIASYLNANIIENRVLVVIAEAFKDFLVD